MTFFARRLWTRLTLGSIGALGAISLVAQPPARSARAASFPESWIGVWDGTLTNYQSADNTGTKVPVTLTISRETEPGVFRWRHVYNNDTTRALKDYRLRTINADSGHYATDEGNGILIDETFTGGMLVSVFQVGDQMIENRTSMQSDSLVQDLIFWKATPIRTSKGTGPNGEQGAAVVSFRVSGRQRSVFVRRVP